MLALPPMHLLPFFAQAAPAVPDHAIVEAAAVGVIVGIGKVWDHVKGRKRDRTSSAQLRAIHTDIHIVRDEVKDLKAHVVGPDGQNGMRSEVRALKQDMDELKRRGHFNTPPEFPSPRPARYEK